MGAWLERRVEGCPSRGCACLFQRDDFGVPDAIPRVEALTDDRAMFDDNGPDHRAWTRETRALLSKVEGSSHVDEIVHRTTLPEGGDHAANNDSTKSSAENSMRSS